MFVERHPNLKVRICHGNTLTAAVVVKELRPDCKEVFMTGATSKLGRAISLYLARKGVRVLMMTNSEERFRKIQAELPVERQPCGRDSGPWCKWNERNGIWKTEFIIPASSVNCLDLNIQQTEFVS